MKPVDGLREELARLAHHYTLKASALQIALEILDEQELLPPVVPAPRPNGAAVPQTRRLRQSRAQRLAAMAVYLKQHPGATTQDLAAAVGMTKTSVLNMVREVAKQTNRPKGRQPIQWHLKAPHLTAKA